MIKYSKLLALAFMAMVFFSVNSVGAEEQATAPDFQLPDTSSVTFALSSYKNKQPVLLMFWTTWCPFCRTELKLLNKRYAQLSQDGLEVLAINAGESLNKVKAFLEDYTLGYPVLLDEKYSVAENYQVMGVPTYVLIDTQGRIVSQDNDFPEKKYKDLISQSASK